MTGAAPSTPAAVEVVELLDHLRRSGLVVPTGSAVTFAAALEVLTAGRPLELDDLYWTGRATLVTDPASRRRYDEAFRAWPVGAVIPAGPSVRPAVLEPPASRAPAGAAGAPAGPETRAAGAAVSYSAVEVLRRRDLAACSAEERDEVRRTIAQLRVSAPRRRSRRRRPSHRQRGPLDVPRTLRRALRTDGEPISRPRTRRVERDRPLLLLLDLSGSMAPYERALLAFSYAMIASKVDAEVFAVGTRLTRLTEVLVGPDVDAALTAAATHGDDWSAGTRLGATLSHLVLDRQAQGAVRGAVAVVFSDGWDQGDPTELAAAMARLRRLAHRVMWVNPLKASPGYEPLARGMAAALPNVDEFVEGHSLEALEALVPLLAGAPRGSRP